MRFFRTETEMSDRNSLLIACKAGDEKLLEEYIAKHQDRNDYVFLDEDGFSPLHLSWLFSTITIKLLRFC